jgi:hypothetical protein
MEWRGVGDKPAKKKEARLLTKGEQIPYSGCVKVLSLAYSGPRPMGKTGGGQGSCPPLTASRDSIMIIKMILPRSRAFDDEYPFL